MPKKRLTPNQKEWNKQAKRVERFIKNAEKRGYRFTDLPFETTGGKIVKPTKITKKQITKLKSFTAKSAYQYAEYYVQPPQTSIAQEVYSLLDMEFNRVISGVEGRKLERQVAARKAQYKRQGLEPDDIIDSVYNQGAEILDEVMNMLTISNNTNPNPQSDAAINVLVSAYQTNPQGLLKALANAPSEIIAEAQGLIYPSNQEERERHLMRFMSIINTSPLSAIQARDISDQYYDTM